MQHGTYAGYSTHRCKCSACIEAGRQWRATRPARYRAQKRFSPEPMKRFMEPHHQRDYYSIFKPGRTIRRFEVDRFCIKILGIHPWFVYGDDWYSDD